MSVSCPQCNSNNIVLDPQFYMYVCANCGLVVDDHPIFDSEEKVGEDSLPRYSGAYTSRVHDRGVGSTEISGSLKRHVKEGRIWAIRNLDAKISKSERRLAKALKELNELVKALNIPKVVSETAGEILHKIMRNCNFKEITIKKIVIAALYVAYKMCGYPKPAKVFVKELGVRERDLWEGLRKIRELEKSDKPIGEASDPRYYVNFISWSLNLKPQSATLASEILAGVKDSFKISGKSPASLAAAAVYLSCILLNDRRSQLEVGRTVGLTDVAVRNAYGALIDSLDVDVLI
jgi:transcription initiation factor TFIIB